MSREPKGQSLWLICRMLRGHNGEKLPHGRDTYQARFRTLVNYEQVRPTTVFSKISGKQCGPFDLLALEDLSIFDAELPRTAAGSQSYFEHEWKVLEQYSGARRDPEQHPSIAGKYRALVPLEQTFESLGIVTNRGSQDLTFHPHEVIMVTAAADRRLLKQSMYSRSWPRNLPAYVGSTVSVSKWVCNILRHNFATGGWNKYSPMYAKRDTGGWVRLDEFYDTTQGSPYPRFTEGFWMVREYAKMHQ